MLLYLTTKMEEIFPFEESLAKYDGWLGDRVDRNEAIRRMKRALNEYGITGVQTTIPFHLKLLENEHFVKGEEVYTDFIVRHTLV